MSRFSKLIDQLEDLDKRDIRNTAKIFGIAADLFVKLDMIVSSQSLPSGNSKSLQTAMNKEELITLKADLENKLSWINEQLSKLD